ncbi:hypothetical protein OF83DRAFT_1171738 [Amylostereum chailletii]|nr:hypothetical protein OF83DRAFT_1171738 [Amylostereum chailletii]
MTPDNTFPITGRHKVTVGSTLNKVLKARKGLSASKANLVQRDFFTLRYNFKPNTLDTQKPGSISIRRGGSDSSIVRVERPLDHNNASCSKLEEKSDSYAWNGTEKHAREWECVLIYDEEMGASPRMTFTLEKLESLTSVKNEGNITSSTQPVSSPASAPEPARPTPRKPAHRTAVDELEAELLDGLEDADGEPDDSQGPVASAPQPSRRGVEDDEDDEEDIPIAATFSPSRAKTAPVKPKPVKKSNVPPPPPKVKAQPKKAKAPATSTTNKRPIQSTDVEEFQISRPPPPKRRKPSPPPPPPPKVFSLALPTSSGPDPLAYATSFAPEVETFSAPTPPSPQADLDDDEDEGEWDVVAALPPAPMEELSDPVPDPLVEDEEMDFIAAAFGEDPDQMDEGDVGDTSFAPAPPVSAGGPISLDDYVGDAVVAPADIADEDEDLFSSTDEDSD